MATNKTPNSTTSVTSGKDSVNVQGLSKKLLKNQRSRLAPSMGGVTRTGEPGR
jgi:hypothetical protein